MARKLLYFPSANQLGARRGTLIIASRNAISGPQPSVRLSCLGASVFSCRLLRYGSALRAEPHFESYTSACCTPNYETELQAESVWSVGGLTRAKFLLSDEESFNGVLFIASRGASVTLEICS